MDEFEEGLEAMVGLFRRVRRDLGSDIALGRDVNTFQLFPAQGEGEQDMVLEVVCLPLERKGEDGGPFAPLVRQLAVVFRPVGESPMYEVEARLEMMEGVALVELLRRSPDVFYLSSFGLSVGAVIAEA